VLDTKWKLLSSNDAENKYGLSQNDFYQLFAYGHKYLNGEGELLLIYPHTKTFPILQHPFVFSSDLKLWVVSFDLENDTMQWPAHWQEPFFAINDKVMTA
jgi:5-methylcytosine-specific restriction enzyme subunit McrC